MKKENGNITHIPMLLCSQNGAVPYHMMLGCSIDIDTFVHYHMIFHAFNICVALFYQLLLLSRLSPAGVCQSADD